MNWQVIERIMPRKLFNLCRVCYNNLRVAREQYLTEKKRIVRESRNEKMRIVFIVQRTEVFNSVRSIFEEAVANEECEVYLLPLPRCANESEELIWDTYASVVEFCHQLYDAKVIDTYDFETEKYYDLTEIMPDYIFLNVPYTIQYPDVYSLEKLALISKVCYVPYGYAMPNEKICSDLYFDLYYVDLMKYVSFFFADGEISYSFCKKNRMWLTELLVGKRLYKVGYPRFDTIDAQEVRQIGNRILWLPRWTVEKQIDAGNLSSHFFDYNDNLLEYVDNQEYYRLVIRPHPLMFENYIKYGLMSEKDVLKYKEVIKNNGKFSLDEKPSYDDAFNTADVLVTDYSSTIIEFFLRGKPVIYCGKKEELSSHIADVTKTFYYVNSWEQLKKVLDDLKNGIDPLKEERRIAVKQFREGKKDAGKAILNVLRKSYESSKEKLEE